MPDDQPPITPIAFTQYLVRTVESWPERTSFMPEMLRNAHVYHATYDEEAQTVTFTIFNGGATYKLSGEVGPGGALVADRVSHRKTSRKVER